MEGQVEDPEELLPRLMLRLQALRRLRRIDRLGHIIQVVALLRSCLPRLHMGMQIREHEPDRGASLRLELPVQLGFDARRGPARPGGEVDEGVRGGVVTEDAGEDGGDELGGRLLLQEGDAEGPGCVEVVLDFFAEELGEPDVVD